MWHIAGDVDGEFCGDRRCFAQNANSSSPSNKIDVAAYRRVSPRIASWEANLPTLDSCRTLVAPV